MMLGDLAVPVLPHHDSDSDEDPVPYPAVGSFSCTRGITGVARLSMSDSSSGREANTTSSQIYSKHSQEGGGKVVKTSCESAKACCLRRLSAALSCWRL